MDITLQLHKPVASAAITITGSKSETNRLLLLQALYPGISIQNISESDDSIAMQNALASTGNVIDIHHAGTAMRFLTAYFALQQGRTVTLTGSQRMRERPIGVLVDALRSLGATIEYVENEGFPPLKITGQQLTKSSVAINAGVSSQYITALLLIAGRLENGLELTLEGELTSIPYIKMTLGLLNEVGIENSFEGNTITVKSAMGNQQWANLNEDKSQNTNTKLQTEEKSKIAESEAQSDISNLKSEISKESEITVESDWSSASYFYSIVALADEGTAITLSSYRQNSLQGDSALAEIYKELGVETVFRNNSITLTKLNYQPATINFDLNNTPDIAQTIAVTCFGLGTGCHLTGLHTLKIKETDRLEALKTELEKFGATISVTDHSLALQPHNLFNPSEAHSLSFGEGRGEAAVFVATYNDHRMAMAFAPLAIKTPVGINDAGVVSKSYPTFWDDMKVLGFEVDTL
ncbi:3-phosphoshikimate 1-carboxyvinyltransferase [Flavobacterium rivuli WB 3.3-2 = DSM 21788]|uniref:3-phosphoshikimate 1-carboxyvinyltransferase n=1 Tax=Flavobacterium rivuli WB 3.3-2 = DSM 21788 TaxID=1121895 RepID=A0A0A2M3V1_9FLAO|nr:3-phosphoshikimate 1-carboxyvinyltransferase [Flavobacterium rivuli]KGO86954.1 3-phosphoshikimate 1-carboxyvinyltransferase [Flavobacterium rivuli WB 3.3-2 = DSM 21788]